MFTIAITNTKGGAGKTTIASLIAMGLKEFSGGQLNIGMLDFDTQHSTTQTLERLDIEGIPLYPRNYRFGKGSDPDYLVIDTPPTLERIVGGDVPPSDFYLIPMGASIHDWKATEITWEYLKPRVSSPIRILFNAVRVGSIEEREMNTVVKGFKGSPHPFRTILHHRKAYTRIPILGWRSLEYASEKAAMREVEGFIRELGEAIGFIKPRRKRGKRT
jgi:cellulose biosynthesis protein BcsQ